MTTLLHLDDALLARIGRDCCDSRQTAMSMLGTSKRLAESVLRGGAQVRLTISIKPWKKPAPLPVTFAWASKHAGRNLTLDLISPDPQPTGFLAWALRKTGSLDKAMGTLLPGLHSLTRLDCRISVPDPGSSSPWLSQQLLASTCPNLQHVTLMTWTGSPDPLRMVYGCRHLQQLTLEADPCHHARRPGPAHPTLSTPASTQLPPSTATNRPAASGLLQYDPRSALLTSQPDLQPPHASVGNAEPRQPMPQLPSLTSLTLKGEWSAVAGLMPLAPQLISLTIPAACPGMDSFVAACPKLESLVLAAYASAAPSCDSAFPSRSSSVSSATPAPAMHLPLGLHEQKLVSDALGTWCTCLPQLTTLRIDQHQVQDADMHALLRFPKLVNVTVHSLSLSTSFADHVCGWAELRLASTVGLCEPNCSLARLPRGSKAAPLAVHFAHRLLLRSARRERGSIRSQLNLAAANISAAPSGRCTLAGISFDGRGYNWAETAPYHNAAAEYLHPLLERVGHSTDLELALMPVGEPTVALLAKHCAPTLGSLALTMCSIDDGFWGARVFARLPQLSHLRISCPWGQPGLNVMGVVRLCQQASRPVKVELDACEEDAQELVQVLQWHCRGAWVDLAGCGKVRVCLNGWRANKWTLQT